MAVNRSAVIIMIAAAGALAGCQHYIAFTTATKFALDVSQKADQTVDVSMGYDRAELASIPASESNADGTKDTYAVLGRFSVKYGNPFKDKPLVLNQFFATGVAARNASASPGMRKLFGEQAWLVEQKKTEQMMEAK